MTIAVDLGRKATKQTKPTKINEPVTNVIDGIVQLYNLSLIPDNFQGVAETVLDYLAKSSRVDFATDTTKENSIKSFEGKGEEHRT